MGREQFVVDTFVELADTLASDYDIGEFLHALVERCQQALQLMPAASFWRSMTVR